MNFHKPSQELSGFLEAYRPYAEENGGTAGIMTRCRPPGAQAPVSLVWQDIIKKGCIRQHIQIAWLHPKKVLNPFETDRG